MTVEWPTLTLGDLTRDTRPICYGVLKPGPFVEGGVPLLRIVDIKHNRVDETSVHRISEALDEEFGRSRLKGGEVLLSIQGTIGRVAICPASMAGANISRTIAVIEPDSRIDKGFLRYFLMFLAAVNRYEVTGTTRDSLNISTIRDIEVPALPLEEQRRIVAILEDHLSRLDEGERALVRADSLVQIAWTSFLSQALSRATQSGQMRRLGEVASTRLGKMLDAKRNTGLSTPYLRNQNVQWRAIDFDDVLNVPLSSSEISDLAVAAGDLLVCEGGEPGRCAVVQSTPQQPVAFQKALHRVRPHDAVSAHYLQLVLEALARMGRLRPLFTGTTIKHLPQERLRALEIPVPDERTQMTLVEEARSIRESLDLLSKETAQSRIRSEALRRSLLTAAFSGQLTKESLSV